MKFADVTFKGYSKVLEELLKEQEVWVRIRVTKLLHPFAHELCSASRVTLDTDTAARIGTIGKSLLIGASACAPNTSRDVVLHLGLTRPVWSRSTRPCPPHPSQPTPRGDP